MYRRFVFLIIIPCIGLLLLHCNDNPQEYQPLYVSLGQTFNLVPGQKAIFKLHDFEIEFDSLVMDSRCQPEALCIDPGIAEVAFTVRGKHNTPYYMNLAVVQPGA